MSRLPRVFVPELPSHLVLRGNDRQDIVLTNADRRRILCDLQMEARANGVRIHAYALMTNHLHLLASAESATAIPLAMQGLGRRYVPYFNLRYGRVGTLWQGRYRSSLIAAERYLRACHRYIEMNPVRAGMVSRPCDYRWSSHCFYALGVDDGLVTPHPSLEWVPGEWKERREFLAMFDDPTCEQEFAEIRNAGRRGLALGDEASCQALEARIGRRITPRRPGRHRKASGAGEGQAEMVV